MAKYIGKRLLHLIPVLIGITLLSFALMHTASMDAVDVMYERQGSAVSEELKAQMREELNLDKPFFVQYGIWLGNVVTGDMGTSYISQKPVFETFVSKLPATIALTMSSIFLTMVVSLPLGILAAVKQNKWIDYMIRLFSFIGNSLPNFFIALLLIYLFSLKLGLFPVIAGTEGASGIVLPTLTLSIAMSAKYTRQIRTAVLEELEQEYVSGAISRGVRMRVVLCRSVLKSCMYTMITLLGLSIGSLLGGTAIVESIFMWDGVGKMAVDAITMRDYPIIQAYVIWMAIIYVMINLITDILYCFLDPRVRMETEERV